MATSRGREEVRRYIDRLQTDIPALLRGAARAGGNVIADEAKDRSVSSEVAENITIKVKRDDGRIVVTITVKPGWAYSLGTWLEWGTDPHFITVDQSQRQGLSVGRINKLQREGSLVIGGQFVGETVFHPGAQPHPFLRVALDTKGAEAFAEAQRYIDSHVTRVGIIGDHDFDGGAE
ncbi:HK97 gp10 family phage protein [Sphingomonas leidyi]|uniref:HK97 gp10 family phage protein n=1 Tax=Sphingomonas leidyi TaxID=68569 RepID=UPI0036D27A49